jgi:hypothetical protein
VGDRLCGHPAATTSKQQQSDNRTNTKESDLTKESGVFSEVHDPSNNNAGQFGWRTPRALNDLAEERASYFKTLQKEMPCPGSKRPQGHQAATLLDLLTIRAFHSKNLRCCSLGTALGFRLRGGLQTNIPAIIVFVARKVHRHWLHESQELPQLLEGPGGVWCDVDVVEFSHLGQQKQPEPVYTELVEGLQGRDATIGSGSQVACYELYGTLGAIVRSNTGLSQVGFLTNRHVAVDLDHPVQKLFHPLPPHMGPGLYLGAVERTTTFIREDLWYGVFASMNPETFVRADGAFIPFDSNFDVRNFVTPFVKGVGEVGEVMPVDLQAPLESLIGKHVIKVGRSSGVTKGSILAYSVEYNNDKGHCFLIDFLIVSDNNQDFESEGDSGSLIMVIGEETEKPRPIGIVWGGTIHRGRLKLRNWKEPENWTSGVDLSRLLDSLELSIITSNEALEEALEVQRQCLVSSRQSSTPRLTIRSLMSTALPGWHIQYMEGGSFRFDHHFTVPPEDRTQHHSSKEMIKDLLSTAPSEAHSQANKDSNSSSSLVQLQAALDSSWHTTQAMPVHRRRAAPVLKVDDPLELSLSSPLSGVEHACTLLRQMPLVVENPAFPYSGLCRIPAPPTFSDALQRGIKRARPSGESRLLPPPNP